MKKRKSWLSVGMGVVVIVSVAAGLYWWMTTQITGGFVFESEESKLDKARVLTISETDDDLENLKEEYQPLVDYLAGKLVEYDIEEGEVILAESPARAAKLMRQGKLDIYVDSAFPAYVVARLADAELLVSRWKKGVEQYHSVVFVRSDSEVQAISDLVGKMIVFEKPDSTSGYFLPKAELLKAGYKLAEKDSPDSSVEVDEIGYYFSGGDKALMRDVKNGVASAGAQNEAELQEFFENESEYRVLLKTVDVYRQVVVVNGKMDEELKESIKGVLMGMDKTKEGKEILQEFKKTAKFGDFGGGENEAFEVVSSLTNLVEKEIIAR